MKYNKLESPEHFATILNYEYYFSVTAMASIILSAVSLITGIACFVLFTKSLVAQLIGAFGFSIFIRLVMGSPFKRRLTAESAKKLGQWVQYHNNYYTDDTDTTPQP